MSGCARHNDIDFSSGKAFFSSLNETKKLQKENMKNTDIENSLTFGERSKNSGL